jgi:ADP-heptose:LPS heptosyltransferase
MAEKIAIIAWGAMADCLYATPIVRYVRSQNPHAEISWLIRDKFAEVIETNPDINHVVEFTLPDGHDSRQQAEYVMDREILAYAKANFDKVIDLQYWPRYTNFYERPSEDFISLRARNAGIDPTLIKDRTISCPSTAGDLKEVNDFLEKHGLARVPFITVNHISYAASPVAPFEYYQQLVHLLYKQDTIINAVFTGATNEPIPVGAIDARGMSYRVWKTLIGRSDFYVGLDSGAKTLACATKVPMAILHSKDFPLKKTGCAAMGIRTTDIMELTVIPTVSSLVDIISSHIVPWIK